MAQKRIVVLDNAPDSLESLCELFRVWGYDVDAADEGKGALAFALTHPTDIVVMDLSLPDGDALDVIRRIKAENEDIIVIAYSGWQHLGPAARDAGADAFVLKPDLEGLERLLAYGRGRAGVALPVAVKKID